MRDDFQLYTKLSWEITGTYFLAVAFFFIIGKSNLAFCILGLILTGFLIYLSSSLRLKKHQALLEALKHREMKPFKPNLGMWYPFMFILWLLGALWCYQISLFFEQKLASLIILIEVWTVYLVYFAISYNDKIKVLKDMWKY